MVDIFLMEKQFTGEYKQAFSKISMYGSMIPIDSDKYEDRIHNIYDVLISAQADEKPVEKVIGNDIEKFCKLYYRNNDAGELVSNIFKRINLLMKIILLYSAVAMWLVNDAGTKLWDMKINLMSVVMGITVGLILIAVQSLAKSRLLFKTDKITNMAYSIAGLIVSVILFIVAYLVIGDREIMVPAVTVIVISAAYILLYQLVKAVIRYIKTGNIRNTEWQDRREREALNREFAIVNDMDDTAIEMAKRLDRINKKREKKNKPQMSYEDFKIMLHKEYRFYRWIEVAVAIYCVGRVVIEAIVKYGTEDYHVDLIITAVACTVAFVVYRWVSKIISEVEEAQRRIMAQCQDRGIDIYEYVDGLKF